ncbi:hypothetical protein JOH50_005704 [Rhizobium leguminosarum]|nr:hypothetical protein [Rhizobium leguminosarum]
MLVRKPAYNSMLVKSDHVRSGGAAAGTGR